MRNMENRVDLYVKYGSFYGFTGGSLKEKQFIQSIFCVVLEPESGRRLVGY